MFKKLKASSDSLFPIMLVVGISVVLLLPLIFLFAGFNNEVGGGGTSEPIAVNPTTPEDARMISNLTVYSSIKLSGDYSEKKNQLVAFKSEFDSYNAKIKADPAITQTTKNKVELKVNQANIIINKLLKSFPVEGKPNNAGEDVVSLLASLNQFRRDIRVAVKCKDLALNFCVVKKAKDIADQNIGNRSAFPKASESNSYFISLVLQKVGIFAEGDIFNMVHFSNLPSGLGLEYKLGNGTGEPISKEEVKSRLQPGDIILSVDEKQTKHLVIYLGSDISDNRSYVHWSLQENILALTYVRLEDRMARSDMQVIAIIRATGG